MSVIVIIEDNPASARLAVKILKKAGHTVHWAADGEVGLTTVFGEVPDIILVDLGLPDIDGETVVALIRQQENLAHVPVIAFTAYREDVAKVMADAYGCDGVITKPIDTQALPRQIEQFLKQATA